mmetsp:Transcript_22408/g.50462  ORF Transcript_22408/g.50462 Transcript_22408/m.50462 type:complete len:215 (-) Transcript_22408:476-1120(-)
MGSLLFFQNGGAAVGNHPDQHAKEGLCDDISQCVAELLKDNSSGSTHTKTLAQVDHRVCRPRHNGQVPRSCETVLHVRVLICLRVCQLTHQGIHDIAVGHHRESKELPPGHRDIVVQLPRISCGDHNHRCRSQAQDQRVHLTRLQFHHENEVHEQHRHCQHPVRVPLGVNHGWAFFLCVELPILLHHKGAHPLGFDFIGRIRTDQCHHPCDARA